MPANGIRRRRCSRQITLAAAGLLLASSSCATAPQFARTTQPPAGSGAVNAHYNVDARDASARRGATPTSPPPPRVVQLKQEERAPVAAVEPERPSEPVTAANADPTVPSQAVPVAAVSDLLPFDETPGPISRSGPESAAELAPSILQVDHSAAPDLSSQHPNNLHLVPSGQFIPAEPRVELASATLPPSQCPSPYAMACEIPVAVYEPEVYPEEYICDGGDRGHRVMYTASGRSGLDTEDTVAEFTDEEGCVCIRPSTRTCIYAPQFAAVRSMSLQQINLSVDKLAGAHDHRSSIGFRSQLTPGVEEHIDQPVGINVRSRVSGLDADVSGGAIARVQTTARHVKLNNVFENELFLAPGGLDRSQEAYLAHAIQLAAAWTRDLNPVIVAVDAAGQEVIGKFQIEEYVGIEDRSRKGDLKIIKVVDEPTAVPGDVVSFTIHYENVGDRSLLNVRIIDNLTPRLELAPDSPQSDREGRFHVEDNHEGSVVLTFELAEALPGRTAGTLTFQCRVR
ncbi:MAG: hypothetical protein AB7U20_20845 [Planctomycetaceae bacterium]